MLITTLLSEIFDNFYNNASITIILILFMYFCFIYLIFCLVLSLISRRLSKCVVPLILSIGIFFLGASFHHEIAFLFDKIRVLHDPKFLICKEKAMRVGNSGFLGKCE